MKTALEVVREVYDRFGKGDLDGFMGLCAPNVEWVVNGPAFLEKCQAYRGCDGVRKFLAILDETWEFDSFVPRQFISEGVTVVVLGEETGADKASGTRFGNRWAHIFDVQDGLIVRFREFLCHWPGGQRAPDMTWTPIPGE